MRAESDRLQARRNAVCVAGSCLAVAAGLVVIAWQNPDGAPEPTVRAVDAAEADARPSTAATIRGVRVLDVEGRHVSTKVDYDSTPPAGGPHDPKWLNCGVYTVPVRNENAVHALEHGAVWITYRPGLSADSVARLVGGLPDTYVIVSPFPKAPAPVVVSAWGRQLRVDSADDPRLGQFVRTFRLASSAPEPGAPCTGGTTPKAPRSAAKS